MQDLLGWQERLFQQDELEKFIGYRMDSLFKKILVACFVLFVALASLRELSKPGRFLNQTIIAHVLISITNLNSIDIVADEDIERSKVRIAWKNEQMMHSESKVVVDGDNIRRPGYVYGRNNFLLYYQDKFVGEFVQYKSNNWHSHRYQFKLRKVGKDKIAADWVVIGPDAG